MPPKKKQPDGNTAQAARVPRPRALRASKVAKEAPAIAGDGVSMLPTKKAATAPRKTQLRASAKQQDEDGLVVFGR